MRLLIDQDEVLAQFTARILEWWNQDHPNQKPVVVEDIGNYWLEQTLGERAAYFIKACMRYPDFFTNLEPIPGAIEGMKTLHDEGHELIIATKCPTSAGIAFHGKIAWMRKHLPFVDVDNFVAIQRKDLLIGDVLLDDSPSNIKLFQKMGRAVVIFDRPWNRDLPGLRAKNWGEFIQMVRSTVRVGGMFR